MQKYVIAVDDTELERIREKRALLDREEAELRKEADLRERLEKEEKKVDELERKEKRLERPMLGTLLFAIAVIAALSIGIYLRIPMLKYTGFYEPDGFYHYSVIRAAVAHNFFIPGKLSISGWPVPAAITEPRGLYWVTLFPYFFLRFFGVSYYTVMRFIPVLFAIFDILGAYYLSRFMSKDRLFGALVIALVAFSMGDAARTSALIYRGDGFVAVFLILSLIFFLEVYRKGQSERKRILFMLLSGIMLSVGNFVWNGAPFATIVYMLSFILVTAAMFIFERQEELRSSLYILGALLVWFAMVNLYRITGQITGAQLLVGSHFLGLYAMLALGWAIAFYLSRNQQRYKRYIGTAWSRFALFAAFAILAAVLLWLFIPSLVYEVFVGNGFAVTSGFSATIQELTKPTYGFLFASFGIALFTTPMSIFIASMPFLHSGILAWLLVLLGFIPYLFMRAYDTGRGWLNGNARLRFDVSEGLLVMIAYMATTAYLQINAIRFNSLVSVPLAIFSAYTIYWIFLMAKTAWRGRFSRKLVLAVGSIAILIFMAGLLNYDLVFGMNLQPADSINSGLLQALAWMKNNTAPNSVVLTLWPDGSVVEGVANRTSVTDSVGSQNAQKGDAFANWVLNTSADPAFLTGNMSGRPDYLLVRYVWLGETDGIFVEAGLNNTLKNSYAYVQFNRLAEHVGSNENIFNLTDTFVGISAILAIGTNGSINSYLVSQRGISPFSYVLFYNSENGTYDLVRQTAYNKTNGETILIMYSKQPSSSTPTNITGAFVFQTDIASSNLFKFLYLCGYSSCAWNNSRASLKLEYANYDTKIFRILYNTTSSNTISAP